jgi:hypothetical protein
LAMKVLCAGEPMARKLGKKQRKGGVCVFAAVFDGRFRRRILETLLRGWFCVDGGREEGGGALVAAHICTTHEKHKEGGVAKTCQEARFPRPKEAKGES